LPRSGAAGLRIATSSASLGITVREEGVHGNAVPLDDAITYEREGGFAYWTASAHGIEEWLMLEAHAVHRGRPVARWVVEGARLEQTGSAVAIVDEQGIPRIRVTAPAAFSESGRALTPELSVSGSAIELRVDAEGEAVLVDPAWTAAGTMSFARTQHTATLLPSGQILVAGGQSSGKALANAELWDPATNTFSLIQNPMSSARASHTSTLLGNGLVFLVGGTNGVSALSACDLYDPATNKWSPMSPIPTARYGHTATLLDNGFVLVTGGMSSTPLASVRVYNPATNLWNEAPITMATARTGHAATLLPNGKVLVSGGVTAVGSPSLSSAELFDPATKLFAPAGSMTTARELHTTTLLPSGLVLAIGGVNEVGVATVNVESYDPATDGWTPLAPLVNARSRHAAALLENGLVLAIGGDPAATGITVESFDASANQWSSVKQLLTPRAGAVATALAGSKAVVIGGDNAGASLSSAEMYTPLNTGISCKIPVDCASGFCIDGVCCDAPCTGTCTACSALKKGSGQDGVCGFIGAGLNPDSECAKQPQATCGTTGVCDGKGACELYPNGSACDDGDACTKADTCLVGACAPGAPTVCPPLACHGVGACNAKTGQCDYSIAPDGSACDDGDPCTASDMCLGGACAPGVPIVCQPLDACHVAGVCDAATGTCSNPVSKDGIACDDGDACTSADSCQAGTCTGGMKTVCQALDPCHLTGECDPMTGQCGNPSQEDGIACDDGDPCSTGDACIAGACTPKSAVVCDPIDACHAAGSCDAATGQCSIGPSSVDCSAKSECQNDGVCNAATGQCLEAYKPDGTPCTGGTCIAGACAQDPIGSSSTASGANGATSGASGSGGAGSGAGPGGSTNSAGTTGSAAGPASDAGSGANCGCELAGASNSPTRAIWALALAALAMSGRRSARRRSDGPTS
jgi:hypothetical protein